MKKRYFYVRFSPSKMTNEEATHEFIKKAYHMGYSVVLPVRFFESGTHVDTRVISAEMGFVGKKRVLKTPTVNQPNIPYVSTREKT